MKGKWIIIFIILLCFSFLAESTLYKDLSKFEQEVVDIALRAYGLKPHKEPASKRIHTIYIYNHPPFLDNSGFLTFFNNFHVLTKKEVVRKGVFLKPGDMYDEKSLENSEQHLRSLSYVRSLAVIIPVEKINEEKNKAIDLLVVTRDMLSLRPKFSIQISGSVLNDLFISLGEYNLLGYNKALVAAYRLTQPMQKFSLEYFDNRLFGSRWQLHVKPKLIFTRKSFTYSGFGTGIKVARPLYSLKDKWGFKFSFKHTQKPVMSFKGNKIRTLELSKIKPIEKTERRYRIKNTYLRMRVTRSFGKTYKKNFFMGYGFGIKRSFIPHDLKIKEKFKKKFINEVLPKDEIESFISLGFIYFQNKFLQLYDYDKFNIQETKRLGSVFSFSNDFALKPILFSDYNFIRPKLGMSYTQKINSDSFFKAHVYKKIRYDNKIHNGVIKAQLKLVMPRIRNIARIISSSFFSMTYNNRDNKKFTLGANTALRGVSSNAFSGEKAFLTNLELRSSSLKLWVFNLGGVLFYDVGHAFDKWDKFNPVHVLGAGLRVFIPEILSDVMRIDIGICMAGLECRKNRVVPTLGVGQAF